MNTRSLSLACFAAVGLLALPSQAEVIIADTFDIPNNSNLNADLASRQSGSAATITLTGSQTSPGGKTRIEQQTAEIQLFENSGAEGAYSGSISLDSSLPLAGTQWSFDGTFRMIQASGGGDTGSFGISFGDIASPTLGNAAADIAIGVNVNKTYDVFVDGTKVIDGAAVNGVAGANMYGVFYSIRLSVDETTGQASGEIAVGATTTTIAPFSVDFDSSNRFFAQNTEADFSGNRIHGGQLLDFEISVVPEPGSLGLLALGGLMMLRRR